MEKEESSWGVISGVRKVESGLGITLGNGGPGGGTSKRGWVTTLEGSLENILNSCD